MRLVWVLVPLVLIGIILGVIISSVDKTELHDDNDIISESLSNTKIPKLFLTEKNGTSSRGIRDQVFTSENGWFDARVSSLELKPKNNLELRVEFIDPSTHRIIEIVHYAVYISKDGERWGSIPLTTNKIVGCVDKYIKSTCSSILPLNLIKGNGTYLIEIKIKDHWSITRSDNAYFNQSETIYFEFDYNKFEETVEQVKTEQRHNAEQQLEIILGYNPGLVVPDIQNIEKLLKFEVMQKAMKQADKERHEEDDSQWILAPNSFRIDKEDRLEFVEIYYDLLKENNLSDEQYYGSFHFDYDQKSYFVRLDVTSECEFTNSCEPLD